MNEKTASLILEALELRTTALALKQELEKQMAQLHEGVATLRAQLRKAENLRKLTAHEGTSH